MKLLLSLLCLIGACLAGCAVKPLTDSEFRGFCYTCTESRFASCDTIDMCNEFDANAVGIKHASRQECEADCQATYDRQFRTNLFNGCLGTLRSALNWCLKYCGTNYPG